MRIVKRLTHVLLIVLTLVVGAAAAAIIVSQTAWFKNWLRGYIVREANQYLNESFASKCSTRFGTSTPDVPTGESITTDPSLMPMASTAIGLPGPLRSASVSCFLTSRLSDQVSPSRRR